MWGSVVADSVGLGGFGDLRLTLTLRKFSKSVGITFAPGADTYRPAVRRFELATAAKTVDKSRYDNQKYPAEVASCHLEASVPAAQAGT